MLSLAEVARRAKSVLVQDVDVNSKAKDVQDMKSKSAGAQGQRGPEKGEEKEETAKIRGEQGRVVDGAEQQGSKMEGKQRVAAGGEEKKVRQLFRRLDGEGYPAELALSREHSEIGSRVVEGVEKGGGEGEGEGAGEIAVSQHLALMYRLFFALRQSVSTETGETTAIGTKIEAMQAQVLA